MRIAVDAMGGDHAPDEIVRGALSYREKGGPADLVLVGREDVLRRALGATEREGIAVRDARDVVAMDEHPANALRRRGDTSIGVATVMVKTGDADAVVSAGNTGATMAAALLSGAHDIHFYGNIEGRDVMRGVTDICVTDGFTGNVLAKGMEGVVDVFVEGIRNDIFGGVLGKVAAIVALPGLRTFRGRMDYDPYASAPLLGVAGVSVVTHGRARAPMMRWAIIVAERAVATGLVNVIGEGVASAA